MLKLRSGQVRGNGKFVDCSLHRRMHSGSVRTCESDSMFRLRCGKIRVNDKLADCRMHGRLSCGSVRACESDSMLELPSWQVRIDDCVANCGLHSSLSCGKLWIVVWTYDIWMHRRMRSWSVRRCGFNLML